MQRRASSLYGAAIAPVGQASRQRVQVPQCSVERGVDRQRQVGVGSRRGRTSIPRRGSAAACACRASPARSCARARPPSPAPVGEDAVAERADGVRDAVGQLLQARAQHLVIVASARVAATPRAALPSARRASRARPSPRRRRAAGSPCAPRSRAACRARSRAVGALRPWRSHIIHVAVLAAGEPRGELLARSRAVRDRRCRPRQSPARDPSALMSRNQCASRARRRRAHRSTSLKLRADPS